MRLPARRECEPVNGVCGMAGLGGRIDGARVCVGAGVRGRLWLCGRSGAASTGLRSLECALWARAVGVCAALQPGVWLVAGLAEILRLHPAAVRVQCLGSAQPAPGHLEVRSQGPVRVYPGSPGTLLWESGCCPLPVPVGNSGQELPSHPSLLPSPCPFRELPSYPWS